MFEEFPHEFVYFSGSFGFVCALSSNCLFLPSCISRRNVYNSSLRFVDTCFFLNRCEWFICWKYINGRRRVIFYPIPLLPVSVFTCSVFFVAIVGILFPARKGGLIECLFGHDVFDFFKILKGISFLPVLPLLNLIALCDFDRFLHLYPTFVPYLCTGWNSPS